MNNEAARRRTHPAYQEDEFAHVTTAARRLTHELLHGGGWRAAAEARTATPPQRTFHATDYPTPNIDDVFGAPSSPEPEPQRDLFGAKSSSLQQQPPSTYAARNFGGAAAGGSGAGSNSIAASVAAQQQQQQQQQPLQHGPQAQHNNFVALKHTPVARSVARRAPAAAGDASSTRGTPMDISPMVYAQPAQGPSTAAIDVAGQLEAAWAYGSVGRSPPVQQHIMGPAASKRATVSQSGAAQSSSSSASNGPAEAATPTVGSAAAQEAWQSEWQSSLRSASTGVKRHSSPGTTGYAGDGAGYRPRAGLSSIRQPFSTGAHSNATPVPRPAAGSAIKNLGTSASGFASTSPAPSAAGTATSTDGRRGIGSYRASTPTAAGLSSPDRSMGWDAAALRLQQPTSPAASVASSHGDSCGELSSPGSGTYAPVISTRRFRHQHLPVELPSPLPRSSTRKPSPHAARGRTAASAGPQGDAVFVNPVFLDRDGAAVPGALNHRGPAPAPAAGSTAATPQQQVRPAAPAAPHQHQQQQPTPDTAARASPSLFPFHTPRSLISSLVGSVSFGHDQHGADGMDTVNGPTAAAAATAQGGDAGGVGNRSSISMGDLRQPELGTPTSMPKPVLHAETPSMISPLIWGVDQALQRYRRRPRGGNRHKGGDRDNAHKDADSSGASSDSYCTATPVEGRTPAGGVRAPASPPAVDASFDMGMRAEHAGDDGHAGQQEKGGVQGSNAHGLQLQPAASPAGPVEDYSPRSSIRRLCASQDCGLKKEALLSPQQSAALITDCASSATPLQLPAQQQQQEVSFGQAGTAHSPVAEAASFAVPASPPHGAGYDSDAVEQPAYSGDEQALDDMRQELDADMDAKASTAQDDATLDVRMSAPVSDAGAAQSGSNSSTQQSPTYAHQGRRFGLFTLPGMHLLDTPADVQTQSLDDTEWKRYVGGDSTPVPPLPPHLEKQLLQSSTWSSPPESQRASTSTYEGAAYPQQPPVASTAYPTSNNAPSPDVTSSPRRRGSSSQSSSAHHHHSSPRKASFARQHNNEDVQVDDQAVTAGEHAQQLQQQQRSAAGAHAQQHLPLQIPSNTDGSRGPSTSGIGALVHALGAASNPLQASEQQETPTASQSSAADEHVFSTSKQPSKAARTMKTAARTLVRTMLLLLLLLGVGGGVLMMLGREWSAELQPTPANYTLAPPPTTAADVLHSAQQPSSVAAVRQPSREQLRCPQHAQHMGLVRGISSSRASRSKWPHVSWGEGVDSTEMAQAWSVQVLHSNHELHTQQALVAAAAARDRVAAAAAAAPAHVNAPADAAAYDPVAADSYLASMYTDEVSATSEDDPSSGFFTASEVSDAAAQQPVASADSREVSQHVDDSSRYVSSAAQDTELPASTPDAEAVASAPTAPAPGHELQAAYASILHDLAVPVTDSASLGNTDTDAASISGSAAVASEPAHTEYVEAVAGLAVDQQGTYMEQVQYLESSAVGLEAVPVTSSIAPAATTQGSSSTAAGVDQPATAAQHSSKSRSLLKTLLQVVLGGVAIGGSAALLALLLSQQQTSAANAASALADHLQTLAQQAAAAVPQWAAHWAAHERVQHAVARAQAISNRVGAWLSGAAAAVARFGEACAAEYDAMMEALRSKPASSTQYGEQQADELQLPAAATIDAERDELLGMAAGSYRILHLKAAAPEPPEMEEDTPQRVRSARRRTPAPSRITAADRDEMLAMAASELATPNTRYIWLRNRVVARQALDNEEEDAQLMQ